MQKEIIEYEIFYYFSDRFHPNQKYQYIQKI